MMVRVRYFASLREALGSAETLEVPEGCTVGGVRDRLIAQSPAHAAALSRQRPLRSALNHDVCDESTVVGGDAELAFFPPVTGG